MNQRNHFTVVFVLLTWMYLWNLTLFWCCYFSHHHCLKVDMFSYGMMLYELLTGRRPALGLHQLQIAKKLSKGIRPALGSPEEVQFCCLHSLLTECWDTKPEKVSLTACSRSVIFCPIKCCKSKSKPCSLLCFVWSSLIDCCSQCGLDRG